MNHRRLWIDVRRAFAENTTGVKRARERPAVRADWSRLPISGPLAPGIQA